jgi:hypothetical protein
MINVKHYDVLKDKMPELIEIMIESKFIETPLWHVDICQWYFAGSLWAYEDVNVANDIDVYTKFTPKLYDYFESNKDSYIKLYDCTETNDYTYNDGHCRVMYRYVLPSPFKKITHIEFGLYDKPEIRETAQNIVKLEPIRSIYYSIGKEVMSTVLKSDGNTFYTVRELFWRSIYEYISE